MNRIIPSCVLFMAAAGILSAQSIAFDSAPAYMAPGFCRICRRRFQQGRET